MGSTLAIVGIFVNFFLGLGGSLIPPLVGTYLPRFDLNKSYIFRFFNGLAAGIVMGVAFVHSIPDSFENFGTALTKETLAHSYAWPGFLVMMGTILTLSGEELVERIIGHHHHHLADHIEKDQTFEQLDPSTPTSLEESSETKKPSPVPSEHTQHSHHDHKTGYYTQLYVLLFGLGFHSFFVGIALGIVDNDVNLFIAIVSHQFFEGLALGARVARAKFRSRLHIWMLDISFALAAPIGIAIGIGVHSRIADNTFAYPIVDGTFQALSGGILIYVSLVHMMKEEMERAEFSNSNLSLVMYLGFLLGAAVMSIIGIWA
jgi:zinc transporter 1/2/3